MAVPHFKEIVVPMLTHIAQNERYDKKKGATFISKYYQLTKEEKEFEPDFRYNQYKHLSRPLIDLSSLVIEYLNCKGLVQGNSKKIQITDLGILVVNSKLDFFDVETLEFTYNKEYNSKYFNQEVAEIYNFINDVNTAIKNGTEKLKSKKVLGKSLSQMIHELLTNCNPFEFEQIIVKVIADVYGGEGEVTRASKDNGIDGIIRVAHPLTPQTILIQVKKYNNGSISLDTIKSFITSVEKSSLKTNLGIFVSTCKFTKPSLKYVQDSAPNIRLLGIKELIDIMIIRRIGVTKVDNEELLFPNELYFGRELMNKIGLLYYSLGLSDDDE